MTVTWGYGLGILTAWLATHVIHHQAYADWGDLITIFVVWVIWDVIVGLLKLFFGK